MFNVSILTPSQVIFDGIAKKVTLPGDYGEFEVLDFHRTIVSLLKDGNIIVDDVSFSVAKGIAKFHKDRLVALVEL